MAKTNTTVPIERLEQQFASVMEFLWASNMCGNIIAKLDPEGKHPSIRVTGLIEHYRELEQHLLQIRSIDDYDDDRFAFRTGSPSNLFGLRAEFTAASSFMNAFAHWTLSSRRVYLPSIDLQAQQVFTHLGQNTMPDILWPYPAFCIGVEQPLFDPGTNRYFDLFLVCSSYRSASSETRDAYTVFAINQRLHTWKPYTSRSRVDKLFAEGKFDAANDRLCDDKEPLNRNETLLPAISTLPMQSGEKIEDILLSRSPFGRQMWRMVIAFVQYLAAVRETASHIGPWTKTQPSSRPPVLASPVGKLITNASQLCHVSSIRTLTADERERNFREAQDPTGREQMYHLRIAYKRARKGERARLGALAEKVVRIPSVPVRPDRKPDSGVEGGAIIKA